MNSIPLSQVVCLAMRTQNNPRSLIRYRIEPRYPQQHIWFLSACICKQVTLGKNGGIENIDRHHWCITLCVSILSLTHCRTKGSIIYMCVHKRAQIRYYLRCPLVNVST